MNTATAISVLLLLPLATFSVVHDSPAAFGDIPSNVGQIDFVRYLDESTAVQAMQDGAFDLYYTQVPPSTLTDPAELDGITVYQGKGGVMYSMFVNPAVADGVFNPFSSQEARYALHYLIDREGIVRNLLGGNGVPMISNYDPYERDYILVSKQLESLGIAYDPELADRSISGALEAEGAEKRDDGLWYKDGSPVQITIFIRDDDLVRTAIGESLASDLEQIGLVVNRTYGDLYDAYRAVYSSDPAGFEWHLYTEAWGGTPVTLHDNQDLTFYWPSSSRMPGFGEPSYWNYENDLLDAIIDTVRLERYDSLEHRAELVRTATMIGVNEAVRIFVAISDDYYIAKDGISGLITPQGVGISSRFNPINAEGKDPLVIGARHLSQGAWNPVGGFGDSYSRDIWVALSDPAMTLDPFTGRITPVRASWSVQTSGAGGGGTGGIDVPDQAITWDGDSHSWVQVGAGTEATSKVTFDLLLGDWHHGVPMTVNDILYPLYFNTEWSTQSDSGDQRYEEGSLYDPELVKGVYVVDADTVEVYLDYWHLDEDEIAASALLWSSMPWEMYAAMEQVVIDGDSAFTSSAAIRNGVSWLSLIDPADSMLVRNALAGFEAANYVPPSMLDGYADDPQERYAASMDWIDATNHAVVSNGPFYLDASPTEERITIRAFASDSYPLSAGHWEYLTQKEDALEGDVTIGMLAPLTGGAQRYGVDVLEAARLAVSDFNSYLRERGQPWSIVLDVRDTQTDPSAALDALVSLDESGVRIVNGPAIDVISDDLLGYADEQDMLLLSCCSALPSRAVQGDALFRALPDHRHHADSIANVVAMGGADVVVPAGRDSPWIDELLLSARENLGSSHGIVVAERITYSDLHDDALASAAAGLASSVQRYVDAYGADRVAVLYVGFEEAPSFVRSAAAYDTLAQVQWFGADLNTAMPNIAGDGTARAFAMKTGLLSVQPAVPPSDLAREIEERVTESAGRAPSVYAHFEYDAVWLLGLSILDARSSDAGAVREALPETARWHVGAVGSTELNDSGDLAGGHYAVWQLADDGGWEDVTGSHGPGNVTIGALVPVTGSLGDTGAHNEHAVRLAVSDFNDYLAGMGVSNWNLSAEIRDTQTDPQAALAQAIDLYVNDGIRLVAGPTTSASVAAIQEHIIRANGVDMALVSCCSTAAEIAEDDAVFRLATGTGQNGRAIAELLEKDGIDVMVPVWINDPFGRGTVSHAAESFEGKAVLQMPSDPDAYAGYTLDGSGGSLAYAQCSDLNGEVQGKGNPTCDGQFASLASALNDAVVQQIRTHGADKVAVLYVGFESDDFVREALQYDALRMVRWTGGPADALRPSLVADHNSDVRGFLADAAFRSSVPEGSPDSPRYQNLLGSLQDAFPEDEFSTAVYSSYDAVWALGLAVLAAGGPDSSFGDVVGQIRPSVEANVGGALGAVKLDENGDLASANYAVYGIERDDEDGWERLGTYHRDGRLVQTYDDPVRTIKIGALLELTGPSAFNDDDYAVVLPLAVRDFNDSLEGVEIEMTTVDTSHGILPAVNTLHYGAYDGFYRDGLLSAISDAISAYAPSQEAGESFAAINGMYGGDLYPFVIDRDGRVAAHGYDPGNIGLDVDTIRGIDRSSSEMLDLLGTGTAEELWWQYVFYDPVTESDAVKRSLLVYHAPSGMMVGAGYHPPVGGDAGHMAALERTIDEAVMFVTESGGGDPATLNGTYDHDAADSPFYAFFTDVGGYVLSSAAHPVIGTGLYLDDLNDLDTPVSQMQQRLANDGDTLWFGYSFNNPGTGLEQAKRALLKLVTIDGTPYYVGSGYYPPERISNFVGPTTSANTGRILQYVNDNDDVVVVSPSSTADALSIPNDGIFRLAPPDKYRSSVLADLMASHSKTEIVVVQRDDLWGQGVAASIAGSTNGFSIYAGAGASGAAAAVNSLLIPVGSTMADFDALASGLASEVGRAKSASGGSLDPVAVLFVGFDHEMVSLFNAIDRLADPGDLLSVDYYGTVAKGAVAVGDPVTGRIATEAGFTAVSFEVEPNAVNTALKERLAGVGVNYDVYTSSVYDSVGLLAGAIILSSSGSGDVSVRDVVASTSGYRGALDHVDGITLDAYGDLAAATDDYVAYSIAPDGQGGYSWRVADHTAMPLPPPPMTPDDPERPLICR